MKNSMPLRVEFLGMGNTRISPKLEGKKGQRGKYRRD
jgi:hypothetical protein